MRKAPPGALPAAIFTSRKLRRQRADMRTRSHKETQRIMARIVAQYADTMQTLHDAGYAIGDVNDKNLLAWADGRIMVLGADSFQVPADNGHNFRCPVGRAEYQAPEVIEKISRPCRSGTCPGSPVRTQRATDTLTGHQSTTASPWRSSPTRPFATADTRTPGGSHRPLSQHQSAWTEYASGTSRPATTAANQRPSSASRWGSAGNAAHRPLAAQDGRARLRRHNPKPRGV